MTGIETEEEDKILSFSHTLQQKSIRLSHKLLNTVSTFKWCASWSKLCSTSTNLQKLGSFLCYADFYTFCQPLLVFGCCCSRYNYMFSTPLCNTRNFTAQWECTLKTANVGLIQSFNDANEPAKGMCLSALGWAVFAALQVSSLDSWETALLSSRDELNTWQMFEEAKQHWLGKPDISLVEAVIWRGKRVSWKSEARASFRWTLKGVCACLWMYVCVQMHHHVLRIICVSVHVFSVCVPEWFQI